MLTVLGMNGSTSNHCCIYCYVHKDYRTAVDPAKVLQPFLKRTIRHLIDGPSRPPPKKKGEKPEPSSEKTKRKRTDDDEDPEYGNCKEARGPDSAGKGPQGPMHFGKVCATGRR